MSLQLSFDSPGAKTWDIDELAALLKARKTSPDDKLLMLSYLLSRRTLRVEELLMLSARDVSPAVQMAAIRGLGRVGGPGSLSFFQDLQLAEPQAREQARFAKTLIAYRLGLPGGDIADVRRLSLLEVPPPRNRVDMRLKTATDADVSAVKSDLGQMQFGIELDLRSLLRFDCGSNRWLFAFNRELTKNGLFPRLLESGVLLGCVANFDQENALWALRYLVLATPERTDEVSIHVYSPSGLPFLLGSGKAEKDRLDFALGAIDRPGAYAVGFSGHVDPKAKITVTSAWSSARLRARRAPVQV